MKRLASILAIMLLGVFALSAQISSHYVFSATTETYTAITGTSISTAVGDNVISNPVDIGFSFPYGVNNYTQVKVSSNGYITLGTTPGSSLNNSLSSPTICPVLAPLWDDTYLQGSAQYLLTGTSPNRVFTVQFTGIKWPINTPTIFNYQVRIYEDGLIEFIYGNGIGTPTNASASIGINMIPGGYMNYFSVYPGNPATVSSTSENTSINMWPGANTKYVFSVANIYANDLEATTITGNQTPTVGISYNYTVTLHNNGSEPQSNYNVKLLSGNTQVASVSGPMIAPQATLSVVIPWTPTEASSIVLEGKVDLVGDEDATNDYTLPLELIVQAAGTAALTIGDGSETARKPVDMSYLNSMFETIFPASEITLNGVVTGLSFYSNFIDQCSNKPTKIWLGTTTQTNLSAGWIPAYMLTQVFNGTVTYPHGPNMIHITLNPATPFTYSGGNLVMLINRPLDTTFYSSSNLFMCQTVGTNRSRNAYSDATVYDPNNMGTVGTVSGQFPRTSIYMVPAAVDPAFSVEPASCSYGQVLLNHTASQVFSVFNSGGGTLNVSNISLNGDPYFSLTGLPTLPFNLNSGQTLTFTAQYLPTAVGNHTASISITDNLARVVHTVALNGTAVDPSLNTMPYTQNFDAVAVPMLPFGWQKILSGNASVTTVSNEPYSSPNCVKMNNSDSALGPFLLTPPMSSSIPINTLRIKFRAKAASGFSMNVGVMSSFQDTSTFTGVQNISLSNTWTEYSVDLRTYGGTGHYIAFKHNQGGNNRSIYIDNVIIETLMQNDLAALQTSGETTPNAGTSYNYSITIFNWGLNAQTDYQVKLFKTGGIELASTAGPAIAGYSQAVVTIPWTPDTTGNTSLYGKVVLVGDQNIGNDQTPNLPITVQESTTALVVVGSGNQFNNSAPVNMYARASLYENIYRQDELLHSGLISIVNFYNSFISDIPLKQTKIWLGMTTQTDLSNGWIPSDQLTLVFDGEVAYPIGMNTISIALQQPYTLVQGFNLVMLVQRPLDTVAYNLWDNFLCQTDASNRALIVSSSGALDPNNPPQGTFTAQYPKTGFYITPGGAGSLSGTVYGAADQPLSNASVRLENGPETITDDNGHYSFVNVFSRDYTVTASAHAYNDLIQYITVPEDSTITLDFFLTPTPTVNVSGSIYGSDSPTVGLAGASIALTGYDEFQTVCDDQGNFQIAGVYTGQTYSYTVTATGYQTQTGSITLGTSDYILGEIILTELSYPPNNVVASVTNNHTSVDIIWLAPTPEPTDRSLIGYKVWRLQQGQEQDEAAWILLTPVTTTLQRFVDSSWNTLPQGLFRWAVKSVFTNDVLSNAVISNSLETTGLLTGSVRNSSMEPLVNATITAGAYTTTTATDGSYTLHLPSGVYSVTCNVNSYYVNTQYNVELVANQTTQLDFTLMPVFNADDNLILETKLQRNHPNPFKSSTTIGYDLKEPSKVVLEIFNLKGQLIRRLLNDSKVSGHHLVEWDGNDEHGNAVGSGIYQYRIKAGNYQNSLRMTLIK